MEKEASTVSEPLSIETTVRLTESSENRPQNARPTEIIMKKHAPIISCADETEALETIVPRVAIAFAKLHEHNVQSGPGPLPQTPKRRRDDGVGPERAAKRARGSAGRTPAPKRTDTMEEERQQRRSPSLIGIVEEEEEMEMTSVVSMLTQPIRSSDRNV